MADIVLSPPLAEPIHLDEARTHLRAPSGDTSQDALIRRAIVAARRHAESYCRIAIVRQQRQLSLAAFPCEIELPVGPLRAVQSIEYVDTAGALQTLSASAYRVDKYAERGRIEPAYGTVWPSTLEVSNAVIVKYTAGMVVPVSAVDAGTDTLTAYGHDLAASDPVRLANSGGAVPAGLSDATPYYVKAPSADTLQVSLTAGGAAVDITGAGTGQSFIGQVPDDIVAALLLLVGHFYEHREQNSDFETYALPLGAERILSPYRLIRFG
jgi:uncharacterized phiE125 gp8 family phage protein